MKQYRGWSPENPIASFYIMGMLTSVTTEEAVRQAIAKVGYENLTSKAVRDGLASLQGFETGLCPTTNMSDDWPYYGEQMRIIRYENGQIRVKSDWIEPYLPSVYIKP